MRGDYFLNSERVGFRWWTPQDLPLAVALWGDPEVTRLIDARGQLSQEEVRARLTREMELAIVFGVQYWPVFLLGSGEHLGCAGLRPYRADEGIYEIGVHLRPAHWRQGYATELARTIMTHAFDRLKVKALFAGHNPNNEGSRALLGKLGFRYTHDEFYPPTGLQHPSYLLTAEEFAISRRTRHLQGVTSSPHPGA